MWKVIAPLLVLVFLAAFVVLFLPNKSIISSSDMVLNSTAFDDQGAIPVNFTCDGTGGNPPLSIYGVPKNAKSLVLEMYDLDAPNGEFVHWVVFNIKPSVTQVPTGFTEGKPGVNGAGQHGYTEPCPPAGDDPHRYVFKLSAVNTVPIYSPREPITKEVVESKIKGRVIEETTLTGTYQRQ